MLLELIVYFTEVGERRGESKRFCLVFAETGRNLRVAAVQVDAALEPTPRIVRREPGTHSAGVERPRRVQVKKEWSCTSTPTTCLVGVCRGHSLYESYALSVITSRITEFLFAIT